MRARTIREGSVGLFILAGFALFGGLVIWLRGVTQGQSSYKIMVDFDNAVGLQKGTSVSYRGVPVGQVTRISPGSNTVTVDIQVNRGDLRIPAQAVVKTSQSGLIGETSVAIQPPLTAARLEDSGPGPTAKKCDSTVIFCSGDHIQGVVGVNYEDLLESSQAISKSLSDPEILEDVKALLDNTSDISGNVISLTDEVLKMVKDVRTEIQPVSASARQTLAAVSSAAAQLETTTAQTSGQLDTTLVQVNGILATNQDNLAITLDNIRVSSGQLRVAMDNLAPILADGSLANNVEILAANAAIASEDLREVSATLNTTENLVLLQQTIESARDVFQSAQKIMADVDTLTGDPALRGNVRELLNGLSDLVSSTSELEVQTVVAEQLNEQRDIVLDLTQETENVNTALSLEPETLEPETPQLIFNGERYVTDLANRPEDPTP